MNNHTAFEVLSECSIEDLRGALALVAARDPERVFAIGSIVYEINPTRMESGPPPDMASSENRVRVLGAPGDKTNAVRFIRNHLKCALNEALEIYRQIERGEPYLLPASPRTVAISEALFWHTNGFITELAPHGAQLPDQHPVSFREHVSSVCRC